MTAIVDYAIGTVATPPSSTTDTTLVLTTGHGARFGNDFPMKASAFPPGVLPSTSNAEKIIITARSGNTLTIQRGQSPTTAQNIAAGWIISNGIFAEDIFSSSITFDGVFNETPNGTRTDFTTPVPFTAIMITKNLTTLVKGVGANFTVLNNTTVRFATAPANGDTLRYLAIIGTQVMQNGSNGPINGEVPSGTVNGSNTTFNTVRPYNPGSLKLYVNGSLQQPGVHFIETSPSTGQFSIADAPLTGDNVLVDYWYQMSPATANADTVDGLNASDFGGNSGQLITDYAGWQKFPTSLAYSSADAPVYVLNVGLDVTPYIQLGDKIMLTHSSTVKYFFVVALTATTMTVLAPVGTTLSNSALSNIYFSKVQSPQGFNRNEDLWAVEFVSNTNVNTGSIPSAATITNWNNHFIDLPIGAWNLGLAMTGAVTHSGTSYLYMIVGLSTANNSFSDSRLTQQSPSTSVSTQEQDGAFYFTKPVTVIAKTRYYLNNAASANNTTRYAQGAVTPTVIRAVCRYL